MDVWVGKSETHTSEESKFHGAIVIPSGWAAPDKTHLYIYAHAQEWVHIATISIFIINLYSISIYDLADLFSLTVPVLVTSNRSERLLKNFSLTNVMTA